MRFDFSSLIQDVYDRPLLRQTFDEEGNRGTDKKMTLGWVCVQALLFDPVSPCVNAMFGMRTSSASREEGNITSDEKLERFNLALKLSVDGIVEITSNELVKLRRLVGIYCPVSIAGRVLFLLDDKNSLSEPKASEAKVSDK